MTPTKPPSQSDHAIRELRRLILSGAYPPGSRLSEVAVARRLGISRTPLRQAMSQLVHEGLLEAIETGGCRVIEVTLADVIDAIELRGAVEGLAARLAAERGVDQSAAGQCRAILDRLDAAVRDPDLDFEAYVAENAAFHHALARLSGSKVIAREAERAARLPLASPSAFLGGQELIPGFRRSLVQAQSQHRAIFQAIEAREGARAEFLTREHARLARTNLDFVIRDKPSFVDRVPGLALIATNP